MDLFDVLQGIDLIHRCKSRVVLLIIRLIGLLSIVIISTTISLTVTMIWLLTYSFIECTITVVILSLISCRIFMWSRIECVIEQCRFFEFCKYSQQFVEQNPWPQKTMSRVDRKCWMMISTRFSCSASGVRYLAFACVVVSVVDRYWKGRKILFRIILCIPDDQ